MGELVTTLRLLITGNSAGAVAALGRVGAATKALNASAMAVGTRMASVGAALTKGLTLPIAAIAAVSIHSASKFEASMKLIQTQCGGTAKDVRILIKAVEEIATKGQHGPDELANALYHLKSVGMDNVQAIEALTQAERLASVGQADLEATTNAVAGAWRTGIKGAENFRKTVGTVNAIIGAGNLRMEELNSALGTGILISAKTFGLSLKDVGAALATLTSQGMPATAAATRLRMAISMLGAPSTKAAGILKEIGLSTSDLAKAMREDGLIGAIALLKEHLQGLSKIKQAQILSGAFGGARSGTTIMALIDGYSTLAEKQDQITKGESKFGAAVKAQAETSAAAMKRFSSTMHALLDVIGTMLLPVFTSLMKKLQGVAEWVTQLSPGWRDFIIKAALVAAAIGPVVFIMGKAILLFIALKTALGALSLVSMGWIGLAIAIGIGLVMLYKKCEWFRDAVNWVGRALLWLWENAAKPAFEAIVAIVKWAWPYIVAIVKQKVAEIKLVIAAIKVVIEVLRDIWEKVRDVARTIWDAIKSSIAEKVRLIRLAIEGIKTIIEFIRNVWIHVRDGAKEIWDQVKDKVKAAVDAIRDYAVDRVRALRDVILDVWRALRDGTANIWDKVVGVVGSAWDKIRDFVNKIIRAVNWVLEKIPGLGDKTIPELPGGKSNSNSSRPLTGRAIPPIGDNGGMGGLLDSLRARPTGRGGSSSGGGIGDWLHDAWDKLKTPWPDAPGGLFGGLGKWLLDIVKDSIFSIFKKHNGPRQHIVELAKSMVGVPYVWGGQSPAGFDCSGLLYWAYQMAGINNFPRIPGRSPLGTRIGRNAIQPADVMFYYPNALQNGVRVPFGHFKMYIGGDRTVESTTGGVQIRSADWGGAAQIRSYLSNGGYTRGPSVVGEDGLELVLPMTRPRRAAQLLRGSGIFRFPGMGELSEPPTYSDFGAPYRGSFGEPEPPEPGVVLNVLLPGGSTIVGTAKDVADMLAPHLTRALDRAQQRKARRRI